jgi:hypothetical protein
MGVDRGPLPEVNDLRQRHRIQAGIFYDIAVVIPEKTMIAHRAKHDNGACD